MRLDDRLGRIAIGELLITAAILVAAFAIRRISLHQTGPWTRGIFLDGRLREILRAPTRRGRRLAARISDVLFFTVMLWPALGESLIWLGVVRGEPSLAWRLFTIDLEAFTAQAVAMFGLQRFVARQRPYGIPLPGGEGGEHAPGHPERWRSFFSGHTAASFTGASLVVLHHHDLALFDGSLLDRLIPIVAAVLAAVVALLRTISDRHWVSDVVAGAALGIACGWLVPAALHGI